MLRRAFCLIAGALAVVLAAFTARVWTVGTRDSSPPDPAAGLRATGHWLAVPGAFDISVGLEDGELPGWGVDYQPEGIWTHLDQVGFQPDAAPLERITAWSGQLHAQLLEITRRWYAQTGRDRMASVETDFRLSCSGNVLPQASDDARGFYYSRFVGSRMTQCDPPVDGGAQPSIQGTPDLAQLQVSVEVIPRKLVFGPRETIQGRVVLHNSGSLRVPIPISALDIVTVEGEDGREPAKFDRTAFFCGGHYMWPQNKLLSPGASCQGNFTIFTDPLGQEGGSLLQEGRWALRFADLMGSCNIPTRRSPCLVEVRAAPGTVVAPRIVEACGAGSAIILRREDGRLERLDPVSGRHESLAVGRVPPHAAMSVAPDGAFLGEGEEGGAVRLRPLLDASFQERVLRPPGDLGLEGDLTVRAIREGEGPPRFLVASNARIAEVDTATDQWRLLGTAHWTRLSPCGGYAALLLRVAAGTWTLVIKRIADGTETAGMQVIVHENAWQPDVGLYAGQNGVYLTSAAAADSGVGMEPAVLWLAYDGASHRWLKTGSGIVIGESLDARLVALGHCEECVSDGELSSAIEIWDVESAACLCRVSGPQPREALLAGDSPRLVCLRRRSGDAGASWLDDRVEVHDALSGHFLDVIDTAPAAAPESLAARR